jgi:hypothetical protein
MLEPMDLAKAQATGKKWLIRVVVWGVALAILGSALYTFASLSFAFSKGDRVGFVQKLSKKGWVCKTNEGELALVNMPGQQAEIFNFTVRDDAVVTQIDALAGHRVVLEYEEHKGVPSSCFGDTSYFVTGVHEAK